MELQKGDVVRSLQGRDAGELFFVTESDGLYALIADGKGRRIEKPKKKKQQRIATGPRREGGGGRKRRYAHWLKMM